MGRTPHDEVAEAARRRLDLLRHELQRDPGTARTVPSSGPEESGAHAELGRDNVVGHQPVSLAPSGRHSRTSISARSRAGAWLSERMPASLRGRVHLGAREFGVLALLLGLGLAVAGVLAIRTGGSTSSPVSSRAAVSAEPRASSGQEPLITPSTQSSASQPVQGTSVVVDVTGKVRRPGVFTLPAGSRVVDAIRKAGGARPRIDLSGLNLAKVLVDGEQVLVGRAPAHGVAAGAAAAPGATPASGMLSLNTATLEQLDGLPGIGPVTAQKILTWRQAHGRFSAVDELLEIDGIGEKTLADLAPMVTL